MPKILKAFTASRKNTVRKYWVYRIRQVCCSVTAEMKMSTPQHSNFNITVLMKKDLVVLISHLKKLVPLDIFSGRYLFHFVVGGQKLTPFVLDLRAVSNLTETGKETSGIWGKGREGRKESLCKAGCTQVSLY